MRIGNGLVAVFLLVACSFPALAGGPGNPTDLKNHPRVDQVNKRIQDQHARIQKGIKNGKISPKQAAADAARRRQLKNEEHAMRAADHGHLTKGDQKVLNHQLNKRSTTIHDQKH